MIGIGLQLGIGLDAPRRLVAVHHRQLDVHQDQVGPVLGRHGARPRRRHAPRSSRSRRCSADRAGSAGCPRCPRRRGCVLLIARLPCVGVGADRNGEAGRSSPCPTSDSTEMRAAVQLDDACARSRARARCRPSCACWCCRPAGTPRRSAPGRLGAMPGPVSTTATSKRPSAAPARDRDLALVGELDGVADQVEQHLGQPPLVAACRAAGRAAPSTSSASLLARASDSVADTTVATMSAIAVVARARARAGRPRSSRGRARR